MKIGIVTLPLHTNYGGILQAWALQTILERMGHEVEVIDRNINTGNPSIIGIAKRLIKKYVLRKKIRVFSEAYDRKYYPKFSQHTEPFLTKYIYRTIVKHPSEIEQSRYEGFVVGSDQIWRHNYTGKEYAFLLFSKEWNVKRIAYAVSFGVDKWEYNEQDTNLISQILKQYDGISVRESSAVDLCSTYLGVYATHVIDPTMLLNSVDYVKLVENAKTPKSPGNLLYYLLDDSKEKHERVMQVAKALNLTPFRVNSRIEDKFAPINDRVQPPVEQWLRGFMDAEFVVADSFHACVFSILFKKPFVVLGNKERGNTRFDSLLSMFNLQDRMVYDNDSMVKALETPIDWIPVYKVLDLKKEEANAFLERCLRNKKAI